jgi:hypothetical protein
MQLVAALPLAAEEDSTPHAILAADRTRRHSASLKHDHGLANPCSVQSCSLRRRRVFC